MVPSTIHLEYGSEVRLVGEAGNNKKGNLDKFYSSIKSRLLVAEVLGR